MTEYIQRLVEEDEEMHYCYAPSNRTTLCGKTVSATKAALSRDRSLCQVCAAGGFWTETPPGFLTRVNRGLAE